MTTSPADVPVREAATVALVRDARVGGGVEVFLQHRVATMQFAAGMSVFPGGGVEPRDYRGSRPWRGPDPGWWAEAFGIDDARAAAAVRGVVRELFEETGVLLAEPDQTVTDQTVTGRSASDPAATGRPRPGGAPGPGPEERCALAAGEGDLDSLLGEHRLILSAHLLRPWDRWTTPPGPPRRYDTLFFVAAVPAGVEPDAGTSEARAAGWMRADDAATAGTLGRLGMLRPTLDVLAGLAAAADVSELLATTRSIAPGGR
ncbi:MULTISPECIES: NUDIX hydrolase [unclassified Dietzia]|uniref:NUDIX hydrolase n=1 Tax=unclassified Dietzia TaxID=2617939 RepID=UPI0013179B90|nr:MULTISPECIES: NUDIX hydrolase [unclassified Dietzia]QGW24997.1 NUDIX family protein [Dietzia sp. DQ12-45-1b]